MPKENADYSCCALLYNLKPSYTGAVPFLLAALSRFCRRKLSYGADIQAPVSTFYKAFFFRPNV